MKKSEIKGWSGLISALLLLGAALIPGYPIVLWLKDGYWTPMPLVLAFGWFDVDILTDVSTMNWEGAKRVCWWMLDVPVSVGFVILALVQSFVLAWLAGNAVRKDAVLTTR